VQFANARFPTAVASQAHLVAQAAFADNPQDAELIIEPAMTLHMVWGVVATDTGHQFTPSDRGELIFDDVGSPSFSSGTEGHLSEESRAAPSSSN
jgi:hypothetical protein